MKRHLLNVPAVESAHAILLVDRRYALQLRDDDAAIAWPGMWGLFGGMLNAGESPRQGLVRELREELDITVERAGLFLTVGGTSEGSSAPKRWWFFEVDASAEWQRHVLHEGQAAQVFDFVETEGLPMTPMTRDVLRRHYQASRRAFSTRRRVHQRR